jgi:hypothetical protein
MLKIDKYYHCTASEIKQTPKPILFLQIFFASIEHESSDYKSLIGFGIGAALQRCTPFRRPNGGSAGHAEKNSESKHPLC